MKALFILLAIVGAVCASQNLRVELASDAPAVNPLFDFVQGFLEGINVKGDINKIMECVKGGEGIIEKVIQALNFLIHVDIKHMEDIIKGIMMLVEAVQEIYKIIAPCANTVEEIKKLIERIISLNIMKIVWRLIANAGQFIHDIQDAVNSFAQKDFHKAGVDVGDILFRLIIADLGLENPGMDFIKGFLEGINEKGDVNKILECIKDIEPIIGEVIKAIQMIVKFNIHDLIEGVKLLIKAVSEIMQAIHPCAEGFEQVKKLIVALTHVDIMKIIGKIMKNPAAFLADFMDLLTSFKTGDFHKAGKDLGDIFLRLFLVESLEFSFEEFIQIVEGFLDGVGHGSKFIDVEECLKKFPEIYTDVLEAINAIRGIDWRRLDKLVEALMKLFDAFKKVLEAIKPCSKAPHELEEMIKKIMSIDVTKLLAKVIANALQLFADFTDLIKEIQEKKYYVAGHDLGDVFYLLIFKD